MFKDAAYQEIISTDLEQWLPAGGQKAARIYRRRRSNPVVLHVQLNTTDTETKHNQSPAIQRHNFTATVSIHHKTGNENGNTYYSNNLTDIKLNFLNLISRK